MGDCNTRATTLPDHITPADLFNHNELNINEESGISKRTSNYPIVNDYGKLL